MRTGWLLGVMVLVAVSASAKPNVVVFVADDFGIGSINAYGAPESLLKTPHLNSLAAAGMRLTNANTPASICSPTRYALLTGEYAWRGPLPLCVVNVFDPMVIKPDQMTMPKYFQ